MEYLYWVVIAVVFILMMILPQRKQKKRMQEMMESLRVGVKVRTAGGFIGTITAVHEDTVVLELAPDGVRVELLKGAVAPLEQQLNQPAVEEEPQEAELPTDVPDADTEAPSDETEA